MGWVRGEGREAPPPLLLRPPRPGAPIGARLAALFPAPGAREGPQKRTPTKPARQAEERGQAIEVGQIRSNPHFCYRGSEVLGAQLRKSASRARFARLNGPRPFFRLSIIFHLPKTRKAHHQS